MASLRTIEISGTSALDRGTQYGQAAADLIAQAIEYYARAFEHQSGLPWHEVLERARPWQRLIADEFPELFDEMTGIASGAGVSLTEIVTLNCRGEIVYDRGFGRSGTPDEVDGCTSFSLTGSAAGDGHVYCGQNWDWRHETRGTVVIVRIVQPPKPTVVMQVEAGQIGRHGANSEGLALNANGLGGRFDESVGVPQTVIRRLVLDSPTISDALRVLVNTKAHIASNALLTHREGYSIDLETTPGPIGWEYPSDGLLVHGNHYQAFVPPQLAATHRPMSPDSLLRVPRARQGLAAAAKAEKSEDVRSAVHIAMSDHLGFPDSLCEHPDDRMPSVTRWSTLVSSCVDLTTGEYYVAPGTPCEHPYELMPFNLYE
ncbi:acyl-CoA--6-aminopenicillanic acid acyltransferase [Kibdelosporangium aridum]|uniref:Acyl-CoA--6-aminopenicillanic acid acyltransferase n=1 Tax=Kibdelosporangium aridum TaxID=2030 RepID=A0A428ZUC8_KIBAR|nr:acyl-CoA--6-aminopenicillanic acid acyltransferase [Kibdelosporangium aridum]RSM91637.1 acyl-CoA--6-aminopenicillanic acid acyltransferase [Kibdelosporangium aridum]